jgi:hypothetical protein
MEANMTYMTARSVRLGFVTLVAAVLIAGACSDAVAKAHKGRLHARNSAFESHAQLVSQQPVRPGPMRYYGGPKSPMSRGPAEN